MAVAASLLILGAYLVGAAYRFPAGVGGLPGPGFFPGVVGTVMASLAVLLGAAALRPAEATGGYVTNRRALGLAVALVGAYLALWGLLPFVVRTALFVAVFLRLLGERTRTALVVAAIVTAVVLGAFQYGLRIDLN